MLVAISISIGWSLHGGVIRIATALILRLIRVGTVSNRMSRVARRTVRRWVIVATSMAVLLVGLVARISHVLPLIMARIIVAVRRSVVIVQADLLDLAVVLVDLLTSLLLL